MRVCCVLGSLHENLDKKRPRDGPYPFMISRGERWKRPLKVTNKSMDSTVRSLAFTYTIQEVLT